MNKKHLFNGCVYKFTSVMCPNNHGKLSVKNKPQRIHQLSTKATISGV